MESSSPSDKEALLRDAFSKLMDRGLDSPWIRASHPMEDMRNEFVLLAADTQFQLDLKRYLRAHAALPKAVTMFFTVISLAARADWRNGPVQYRPIAARAWFLGRWIPTFLIIDGPVGRFIYSESSPFHSRFGPSYPFLTSAPDFLSDRLFRLLRNGFAHWSFEWEVVGRESYVVALDWERDLPTAKLHQSEADAFHIAAFSLITLLYDVFLSHKGSASTDA